MSDTPRTDAVYNAELLERGIQEHGRTWGWGTVSDFRDLCRQLERELAKSKHQIEVVTRAVKNAAGVEDGRDALEEISQMKHDIRRLIEERDRARIQADHKWRLREEFEALLGTSDVETGVERVKEAQRGAARYQYLRTLNKREFCALVDDCLYQDLNFDAEVDRRRSTK